MAARVGVLAASGLAASGLAALALGGLALGGLGLGVLGCDLPPERDAPEGPRVLGAVPADGEVGVDRVAELRVFFDRSLSPSDVHRGHVSVQSGTRGIYLEPRFDPVERALRLHHDAALDPGVLYRLEVEGIRDLDGHEMNEPFVATFTTGEQSHGDPAATLPGWAEVAPIFEGCAADGCHASDAPALGLDLSSGEAIRRTAVGVVAEQSRLGVQGDAPWQGADALAGLARIDVVAGVGRPSRSYLLYKVLGDPHVWGDPMPPPPESRLSAEQARLLSDWILAGAPTR